VIVGPTASGKTALAVRVAEELNGELVSADSRQVYKGMDIGTAMDLDHKHYLVDMREPDNPLTLVEWQREAFAVIDKLAGSGKMPILVGGTMLYVDSIVDNYNIPEVEPDEKLREQLEGEDVRVLYEKLLQLDPKAQKFIEPNNKRRIIRALEVMEATGEAFSTQRRAREPRYDVKMIGIQVDWDELRERIKIRAQQMLDDGLLEETRKLQERYGDGLPMLQTMNYKQALEFMAGLRAEKETVDEMVRVTMRYARRQMSWWRRRRDIKWVKNPESLSAEDLRQLLD